MSVLSPLGDSTALKEDVLTDNQGVKTAGGGNLR
jgi:hypothetical protein